MMSEASAVGRGEPGERWRPILVMAGLGAASGVLSTWLPGPPLETGPFTVLMVLAGVWFGLVAAAGALVWGRVGATRAVLVLAATWVAWEVAVNVAMMAAEGWLLGTALDKIGRYAIGGLLAGFAGAGLTAAALAAAAPAARAVPDILTTVGLGGLFGLLLPLATELDAPLALFVPWQASVAAALAWTLVRPR